MLDLYRFILSVFVVQGHLLAAGVPALAWQAVFSFYVLSGFLITGILLRSRPEDLGMTMGAVLRVFYIRRFLRIFPLYYGVLAICLVFGVGPIYDTWPWHVSYMSNMYYAWHGHGPPVADPYLHFWSLGVEEQFYLLWPLVALVAARRSLLVLLCACIVGSLAFRDLLLVEQPMVFLPHAPRLVPGSSRHTSPPQRNASAE